MERLSSRERLIQTTAQFLQEKGYYGTGLKDILKLSGTPSGSLYHYFPDGKEELTAAAIRSAGRRLEKQIETTIENHPDLYRALQEITSRLSQKLIDSGFQKGCPIATVVLEIAAESDRIQKVCSSIYFKWQNLLSAFLQRSEMKEDQVKPVSILLLAVIEGALVLCRAHRSIEPLEIVSKQLENILNILT
ncbi:TetR/AcrR family transcriptional regulator [Leptospira borgpetersenii]|uniref:TetR/AcrR family transcriptional regulator n=1 Tax=Leptospira borgpetersenii TaxID=174 RepID=UPI0018807657|nr:TetR/AcrR family transcriptional regulator [Leptospira borgpetersenii]MBE8362745.1 TetR/AcrR family transcriptional regulator [Leptospira borgpetersenii serovar Balcanica]MBE8366876.1 TetR/AcrR family transcriptional regulator [Leptospira borgpetersenii serovar Balcanica]MBE8421799.1 TetR/AcrR family transcriptional regulator [Leptospira borgpetersenii serovar Balcanica]MBF3348870.1 TetR/AcrR family transcriptional regulator [Leptospira borgpetersenii serovar Balcanica]